MKRNRPFITATMISITNFFFLSLLVIVSVTTISSVEAKEAARVVNAYGILSTHEPTEIARVQDEIKTRLKGGSIKIITAGEAEKEIVVASFSHNEGLKKLKTYLNTVENVERWIFDAEVQTPVQSATRFIHTAALFTLLLSLLMMALSLVLHLNIGLALRRNEIETWKNLGADSGQLRKRFWLPLFLPPAAGLSLSLAFSLLFSGAHFVPRFDSPDISPILLSMIQSPNIVSEIVLPITDLSPHPSTRQTKKREWISPLEDFWSRKRIKNIESARQGVLLEAKLGEAVAAASDGVVVYDGQMRGLGKMVILDHGRGLHSVYAHLGEIKTRIDETLQKGQTLGYIGDNVFYFELRQNGKPKAVETYIRKP